MAEISMADYFKQLDQYSKNYVSNNNDANELKTIILSSKKASGSTAIFRLIPDVNRLPVRLLHNVYECWLSTPVVNESGEQVFNDDGSPKTSWWRYFLCDAPNYTDMFTKESCLTPDQKVLIEKTFELLNRYASDVYNGNIDTEETGLTATYRAEVSVWYGKLVSWTGDTSLIPDGTDHMYLFRNHSKSFFQEYCSAMNNRSKMKGSSAWIDQYVNRETGTHTEVCSITTTLERGYKTQFMFDEVAPFDITEEDLECCIDLRKKYIDTTQFNQNSYNEIYEALKKIYDNLSNKTANESGMHPAQEPPKTDAQTAYAHVPSAQTSTVGAAPVSGIGTKLAAAAGIKNVAPVTPQGPPTSL